jgi:flagellar basal body-associated protein FliL
MFLIIPLTQWRQGVMPSTIISLILLFVLLAMGPAVIFFWWLKKGSV